MKKLFLLLMTVILTTTCAFAQAGLIKGTVVSASDNEPLMGATVVAENGQGTATDIDGNFVMKVEPGTVLKVSYVGYGAQNVKASNGMVIKLQESDNLLDEIVVTGYGSGKKLGSVVGSVSVVKSDVFKNTPASNFVDALQGQVSGLQINSNSGDPSSTNNYVAIRGRNSLSLDVTPLYIVDGAPVDDAFFNSLNPSDISNITVLKDASAIAIYGSRGANGIILVTTKAGHFNSEARTTVRANYGWSAMVQDNVEMMNSKQYMQFREMMGQPLSASIKNLINNYGISTKWRDLMFRDNAPVYSVDATVSGGSDNTSYYVGVGHYSQEGIIQNSEMKRTTLTWSLDSKMRSWLKFGFSGNAAYRQSKYNLEDDSSDLYLENPMLLSRMALPYDSPYNYKIDDEGNLVYGSRTEKLPYSGITMPWYIYSYDHSRTNRVSGNLRLYEEITPIKGLVIKAQQAFNGYDNRNTETVDPRETFYTGMGIKIGQNEPGYINPGSNRESFSRYYQFTYTNTAEYTFDVAEVNHFRVLVGEESIIQRSESFGVATSGTTDKRQTLLSQGISVSMPNVTRSKGEIVMNSYFANGNYDYDNRYFLDFSYRRDGSSVFAPNHRWGNFGAFGLMWNMKNEEFLKKVTWLDDLRVRYSYGVTGNTSGIANFAWVGTLQGVSGGYNGSAANVLNPNKCENLELTWESVYSHDFGVNLRIFDVLSVTADFYKKTTKNMLYPIPFSLTVGASSGTYNACSMSNTGVEMEFNADLYKDKDWYLGARFQFNYNKNEITELWDGNDEYVIANTSLIMKVGDPMGQYYMVRYVGVDPADGKQVWLDKNDNPTKVFPSDAYVATGKSQYAPFVGGFGVNARWKGLSLSTTFVFQKGKYMVNNDRYFTTNPAQFGGSYNQSVDALNMWTHPGQVTNIPAFGEEYHLGEDTSWLEDASFTRLKNLTLSYDLPKNIVSKIGLRGLQLHFTGRNLWTISNFSGYDPEAQSNMVQFQYPNTRQYEFGLEVNF